MSQETRRVEIQHNIRGGKKRSLPNQGQGGPENCETFTFEFEEVITQVTMKAFSPRGESQNRHPRNAQQQGDHLS